MLPVCVISTCGRKKQSGGAAETVGVPPQRQHPPLCPPVPLTCLPGCSGDSVGHSSWMSFLWLLWQMTTDSSSCLTAPEGTSPESSPWAGVKVSAGLVPSGGHPPPGAASWPLPVVEAARLPGWGPSLRLQGQRPLSCHCSSVPTPSLTLTSSLPLERPLVRTLPPPSSRIVSITNPFLHPFCQVPFAM